MKSAFLSLALFSAFTSFQAHANDNYNCYVKAAETNQNISNISSLLDRNERSLDSFNSKSQEALEFSLRLASGNLPPNDYNMSLVNYADNIFISAIGQTLNTITMLYEHSQFSRFKTDFNNCLSEEVKLKCPQTISNFNNRITSIISNHQELLTQHESLSKAKTYVFSELKNYSENKIVMTPSKFQEFYEAMAPSQFHYKNALRKAHKDTEAASSLIQNDLIECLLK